MQRAARLADVELVDVLTRDREVAEPFVSRTLGDQALADRTLRQTLLTHVHGSFSSIRTAARLYARRNTVERRIT
ncbi:hypothetical protein [Streptomyces sp. HD]|uniref:hypothetical protein n=1 Tax=Streptomyces sp. HD TaxID=3020892 RepID=UPI00232C6EBA|nr:hypothetical protein [Streptomyces sp. HD]MDC0772464.1 hypothetical protein [Streptomyces sp. HD]